MLAKMMDGPDARRATGGTRAAPSKPDLVLQDRYQIRRSPSIRDHVCHLQGKRRELAPLRDFA